MVYGGYMENKTRLQKAKEKLIKTLENNLPLYLGNGWIQNEINKLIKLAKSEIHEEARRIAR